MPSSTAAGTPSGGALPVLVLDNGGSQLRAGVISAQHAAATADATPTAVMPNTIARLRRQARIFIGDETEGIVKDPSQLRYCRPLERGFMVDADVQALLWDRMLSHGLPSAAAKLALVGGDASASSNGGGDARPIEPAGTFLLVTAQPFMPAVLEADFDALVFERFGFAGMYRATGAELAAASLRADAAVAAATSPLDPRALPFFTTGTGIIVDAGFSGTTVSPFFEWRPVACGIRRLDVGGKALTNYLKELLSFRQYNLMDDSWLVNRVKERLCFVAQSFGLELAVAQRLGTPAVMAKLRRAAMRGAAVKPPSSDRTDEKGVVNRRAATATSLSSSASLQTAPVAEASHAVPMRGSAGAAAVLADGAPLSSTSFSSALPLSGSETFSSGARPPLSALLVSSATTRPAPDGRGVGIRRALVLPDHVRVRDWGGGGCHDVLCCAT